MAAKHLYLPALADTTSVPQPEQTGVWRRTGKTIYHDIADSIQIDEKALRRGAASIPDVWARPIGFQTALRKRARAAVEPGALAMVEETKLHERAVREWRGMLSLLALHRIHNWRIEFVPVDIEKVNGPLTTALKKLAPKPIELEAGQLYHWTELILIRCEGVPIGGFSPATLVYTAADYARDLLTIPSISLKDELGYLAPPTGKDDLEFVAEWVSQLQSRLNGRVADGDEHAVELNGHGDAKPHVEQINELLTDWLEDLSLSLGRAGKAEFDAKNVDVSPSDESAVRGQPLFDRYRVYAEMCRPLEWARDVKRSPSDLALAFSRNQTTYQHVVVISPRLLRRESKIWDAKKLEHVGNDVATALATHFSAPSGFSIDKQNLQDRHAIWIRPELYFLADDLLAAEDGKAFLSKPFQDANSLDEVGSRYVLPFRREILDFFSPKDIRENLKPRFKATEGGVQFSFHLPINGSKGREDVVIERVYKYKNARLPDGAVVSGTIPTIDLFPKPSDESWRRYFLIHDAAAELCVVPELKPLPSPGADVVATGAAPAEREDVLIMTERVHVIPGSRDKTRVVAISRDRAYPEALDLRKDSPTGAPRGLILTPPPEWIQVRAGRVRIGVDFGTSNTNAFRIWPKSDTAERLSFNLRKRLVRVTQGDNARREVLLRDYLLPDVNIELPIPTALRVHPPVNRPRFHGTTPEPLLDSFIHFPGGNDFVLPPNVYTNLKWDRDESQHVQSFLESLLFLLLIDIADSDVASVEWAFSYPKAFTIQDRKLFKANWEEVLDRLLNDEHRVMTVYRSIADAGRKIQFERPLYGKEGIAAGYYFADKRTMTEGDRADIGNGALCLDVGGGTTDISLWQNDVIVLDASILLAGRQVSALLQGNQDQHSERIVEYLFETEAAAALEQKKNEGEAFAARLNLILKEQDARIQQRLVHHARKPELQWLRQMIAIEFGAISYYSGSLIAAAADRAVDGSVRQHIESSGITLYWGGNAAKFINWIDFGRYDADGVASRMLNAILFNSLLDSGIRPNESVMKQLQSPGHKSETAGGLVVMRMQEFDGKRSPTSGGALTPASTLQFRSQMAAPSTAGGATAEDNSSSLTLGDGAVCGEEIELIDGTLIQPLDLISERILFQQDRTTFKKTRLTRLARFVEIVNHFGVSCGLFNDETKIDLSQYELGISNEMKAIHISAARRAAGDRLIEPVFIAEVKKLLELMRDDAR